MYVLQAQPVRVTRMPQKRTGVFTCTERGEGELKWLNVYRSWISVHTLVTINHINQVLSLCFTPPSGLVSLSLFISLSLPLSPSLSLSLPPFPPSLPLSLPPSLPPSLFLSPFLPHSLSLNCSLPLFSSYTHTWISQDQVTHLSCIHRPFLTPLAPSEREGWSTSAQSSLTFCDGSTPHSR